MVCYYGLFSGRLVLASPVPSLAATRSWISSCWRMAFLHPGLLCYMLCPPLGRGFSWRVLSQAAPGPRLTPVPGLAMRGPPRSFATASRRDIRRGRCWCSPSRSGHQRRVFWMMLRSRMGLIVATVVGRFHYAITRFSVPLPWCACSAAAHVLAPARARRSYSSECSRPPWRYRCAAGAGLPSKAATGEHDGACSPLAERVARFGTTVFSEFSALALKHGR